MQHTYPPLEENVKVYVNFLRNFYSIFYTSIDLLDLELFFIQQNFINFFPYNVYWIVYSLFFFLIFLTFLLFVLFDFWTGTFERIFFDLPYFRLEANFYKGNLHFSVIDFLFYAIPSLWIFEYSILKHKFFKSIYLASFFFTWRSFFCCRRMPVPVRRTRGSSWTRTLLVARVVVTWRIACWPKIWWRASVISGIFIFISHILTKC